MEFSELHELEGMYKLHADSRGLSLRGVRAQRVKGKAHYGVLQRVLCPLPTAVCRNKPTFQVPPDMCLMMLHEPKLLVKQCITEEPDLGYVYTSRVPECKQGHVHSQDSASFLCY